jgi:type II secretory pathway predicted ATPase ExeA
MIRHTSDAQFRPLRLKTLLADQNLSQTQWGNAIRQQGGQGLSPAAASQLLNWGAWPKRTQRETIVVQTTEWLRAHGVPEANIATAFEVDVDSAQAGNPVSAGIHVPHPGRATHDDSSDDTPTIEAEMLTPAAKRLFNLFRDPFSDDVQGPDDLFMSADQRYVREAMYQATKSGGWFIAVVGESGSGKTTLRRETIDRANRESLPAVIIQPQAFDKTILTARHICEAILAEVRSDAKPRQSLEALARQVQKALVDSSRGGQTHVLMIEEAHDLSIQTLKYLKRFWELEDGFKKLLSIVLIGQPELKNKLDEKRYAEAREVIRRCEVVELFPMDYQVGEYLALKFRRIGRDAQEFLAPDAMDAIRQRLTTTGRGSQRNTAVSFVYPLVVNNLVTKAMNEAARLGAPKVTADIVMGC